MNNYYLAFKYKCDVVVVKVTANELANELLGNTDDILDFKMENETDVRSKSQFFSEKKFIYDNTYLIEFDSKNPHCFNLYATSDGENENGAYEEDEIIAKGLPWICVRIDDEDGNTIYNLNNEF